MSQDPDIVISNLLDGLRQRLRSRWEAYRKQSYNQNTKGAAYEEALAKFLTEYVGGAYDIRTRTAVVDNDLRCFDLFTPAQNEIDVVAIFPQAKPQIVFESEGMTWVPYYGVAFICEVKSSLTTTALRDDLDKTEKLQQIERENGFGVTIGGKSNVNHQLKCLVYDKSSSVSHDTLTEILEENLDAWDLVLLVENDEVIANPNLPFSDTLKHPLYAHGESEDEGLVYAPNGLLWFLAFISVSIPHPPSLTTINPLLQMVHHEALRDLQANSEMVNAEDNGDEN